MAIVAVVVVAAALSVWFTRDDDETVTADGTETTTTTTEPAESGDSSTTEPTGSPVELKGAGQGKSITGEPPCPAEDGSSERTTGFDTAPPMCIDSDAVYLATITTNKGTMVATLDAKAAPKTVNNFVFLSRYKFYDGAPFFRIVKDFAAQTGDPNAAPSNAYKHGYTIPDELPEEGEYEVGSLAMANAGANTGGSQWFVVLGENGASLPPDYALFGKVTSGIETVEAINAVPSSAANGNDGAPHEQVTIESIVISEEAGKG